MKEEPALTRRLINEEHETWAIMRDDIRVGTIGLRTGQPNGMPAWAWFCGFDPGCAPGQHRSGVADSFEEARASFQRAWEHLQTVMPADAYERHREWQEHDRIRMQRIADKWTPPVFDGWMPCVCGVRFNSWDPPQSQEHCPHIYAAQADGSYYASGRRR